MCSVPGENEASTAPTRGPRLTNLRFTGAVTGVTVLVSAVVLWEKHTPDALLRVNWFFGAVIEVVFWGWPAFAVYIWLARDKWTATLCGVLIFVAMVRGWSAFATDPSSTASVGPGFLGWLLLPAAVGGVCWCASLLLRFRDRGTGGGTYTAAP
jgi:hypothetical protein